MPDPPPAPLSHDQPTAFTMQSKPMADCKGEDHFSSLPLETLHHIFTFIATPATLPEYNHKTLTSLLRVSKYIAYAVLPFIYGNPYVHPHGKRATQWLQATILGEAFAPPTRVLLSKSLNLNPKVRGSKVLDVVYRLSDRYTADPSDPDTDTDPEATPMTTTVSPLDYSSHIRHVCLKPDTIWSRRSENDISPRVLEYLRREEEKAGEGGEAEERFEELIDTLPPGYLDRVPTKWDLILTQFQITLFREVIWYVAEPILEQLQGLTIPISDIDRYLEVVGRLGSLEQVMFVLDEPFDFNTRHYASITQKNPEWVRIREKEGRVPREWTGKKRKAEAMRKMVKFVKEHSVMFRGQLDSVMFKDGMVWWEAPQSCPEDVQLKILSIIRPAPKLTTLTADDWILVKAHPDTIDLSWIEAIDTSKFARPVFEEFFSQSRGILQRCRRLTALVTGPLGRDGFKWAVQEKRDLDHLGVNWISGTSSTAADGVLQQDGEERPAYVECGLVPVVRVELKEEHRNLISDEEVNDLAIAFNQTLRTLLVEGHSRSWQFPNIYERNLYIGRGWVDMPVLTRLHLHLTDTDYRVVVDRELLEHCPNVESFEIGDNTWDYECAEIVPCLPGHLPRLEKLSLTGWSGLTFDPATLHSTRKLQELSVGYPSHQPRAVFIPPLAELFRSFGLNDRGTVVAEETEGDEEEVEERIVRPRWTWDWQLPQLGSLSLSGETGYLFQFKMLAECPQLKWLTLSIWTRDCEMHSRVVTEDDLFLAGSEEEIVKERIVAKSVLYLTLDGNWLVESETVLTQFLSAMFPSVTDLTTRGGSDGGGIFSPSFGLPFMMNTIRNNPACKWEYVDTELEDPICQEILDYGLYSSTYESEEGESLSEEEMFSVVISFRSASTSYSGEDTYRVLRALDFERDVSWASTNKSNDYLTPMQVPWVV